MSLSSRSTGDSTWAKLREIACASCQSTRPISALMAMSVLPVGSLSGVNQERDPVVDRSSSARWRAFVYSIGGGVRALRRLPGVVALTAIVVAVSVFVGVLSVAVLNLVSAGSVELLRATTIVAVVDHGSTSDLVARLGAVSGVEGYRPATLSDLAEVRTWGGAAPGVSDEAVVLELSGTRDADEVVHVVSNLGGVRRAAVSVGDDFYLVEGLMEAIVPWLSALLLAGAVVMVANLARMMAATRVDEATTMRLVGAGRLSVLFTLAGPTCAVVLAASAVAVTGFLGLYWIATPMWLSPQAAAILRPSDLAFMGSGLVLAYLGAAGVASFLLLRRVSAI